MPAIRYCFSYGKTAFLSLNNVISGSSAVLAHQPPPRRGNDTRNKNGDFCCNSTTYTACFLRGGGVMPTIAHIISALNPTHVIVPLQA